LNSLNSSLEAEKTNLESDKTALQTQIDNLFELFNLATIDTVKGNVMVQTLNSEKVFGSKVLRSISQGSGVIFREDAIRYYVLTNNHVTAGVPSMLHDYKVFDYKMKEYPATLLYNSPDNDLSIVSFAKDPAQPLKVLTFATANPAAGETVIAIGQPEGQVNAITFGKVLRYEIPHYQTDPLLSNVTFTCIVHDAYINNGNSGGMLVNSSMQVVGINTFGTETNEVGLSVPVEKILAYLAACGYTFA
jgi:S1-C subfamily serine protease